MNNNVKNALIVVGLAVGAFVVYKYVIAKPNEKEAAKVPNEMATGEDKPVVEQVEVNMPAMS